MPLLSDGCICFSSHPQCDWHILPQNAWGKACCTGTNYIIRAAHLAEAGNFPTYSMVRFEDERRLDCQLRLGSNMCIATAWRFAKQVPLQDLQQCAVSEF